MDRLEALWSRPKWRQRRFQLKPAVGEHPCFAGFTSMIQDSGRCGGWQRTYPEVGQKRAYLNVGMGRRSEFTLEDLVAGHINVWAEEGSTDLQRDVAVKAAEIYANVHNVDELKPAAGSASWMEHECKVMGEMPFMYTCSNRINVLLQRCGFDNAFVMAHDFLVNFPGPVNNKSSTNADIIFYLCQELVDVNPNPYHVANTFAHELAHVIQGGFGTSTTVMMEGGATWLEGSLLNLAPRPMVYAWGFRDWNRINAAHIYAQTKRKNARKFYQIHAMLLTYLSQAELLGDFGASALQNYQVFSSELLPFGRNTYDYYFHYVGQSQPQSLETLHMDVSTVRNPFSEVMLNFRVAIAAQCIVEAAHRPSEARYLMPPKLRDRPFWDCTSFPTYWSGNGTAVNATPMELHYGGAAIYRLAMMPSASIGVSKDADWQVRTKILAAGTSGQPAEIRELRPGESTTFEGEPRELYVVQVNVDPEGETLSRDDKGSVWARADCKEVDPDCHGKAWTTASQGGLYPNLATAGLRSPILELPQAGNLTMNAWWDMEEQVGPFMETTTAGCEVKGWDGVQVRLHIYKRPGIEAEQHGSGDEVVVLRPKGGYDDLETVKAVASFARQAIDAQYPSAYRQDCASQDGWTGRSHGKGFTSHVFDLNAFGGQRARIEVLFASDASFRKRGFWLKDLNVRAGNKEVFQDVEDLHGTILVYTPPAGQTGAAGVPVVVQYPDGFEADRGMQKSSQTRSSPFWATWRQGPQWPESNLRRQYLGWSYQSDVIDTRTARLHPGQEACLLLSAPFRGLLTVASLFTLRDKIGIRSVGLTIRGAAKPYEAMTVLTSPSPGVTDPGIHRFRLAEKSPIFEPDEKFFLCISAGDVRSMSTDGTSEPFLHLPLSIVTSVAEGVPGWMMLRSDSDGSIGAEALSDVWKDHRLSLRAEFLEQPQRRLRGAS